MLYDDLVSSDFAAKVQTICSQLGFNPDWLMYVMHNETGGTFSPSIKNPVSTATGLIQFLESTAEGLGTTTAALSAMSAVDQLDYVQKYYQGVISNYGNINTVGDAYLAVFYPAAIGWDNSQSFPASVYNVNKIFDYDKLGSLTKQDFEDYINAHYSGSATDTIPTIDAVGIQRDYTLVILAIGAIIIFFASFLIIIKNGKK